MKHTKCSEKCEMNQLDGFSGAGCEIPAFRVISNENQNSNSKQYITTILGDNKKNNNNNSRKVYSLLLKLDLFALNRV